MQVNKLQEEIARWQRDTFGDHQQTVTGMWHHLADELREAAEGENAKGEELADVAILAFGLADRQGLSLEELIVGKLMELRKRTWLPPDENGVIKHRKED